jgi:hypothetical protein
VKNFTSSLREGSDSGGKLLTSLSLVSSAFLGGQECAKDFRGRANHNFLCQHSAGGLLRAQTRISLVTDSTPSSFRQPDFSGWWSNIPTSICHLLRLALSRRHGLARVMSRVKTPMPPPPLRLRQDTFHFPLYDPFRVTLRLRCSKKPVNIGPLRVYDLEPP